MKISALMIPNPITIMRKATIREAIERMKVNSIRHLPVVTRDNRLEGFLTLADLKQGLIPSMVSNLSLEDLMIQEPIVIGPNEEIETAARLIYDHKISGIPVVKNSKLVGIITETDILRAFIDMMGILKAGSRIDVAVGDEPEGFRRVLHILGEQGCDVINIGMTAKESTRRVYYFRLTACRTDSIRKALEKEGFQVLDAMN
jgi:acetoin utilization protein AcuB